MQIAENSEYISRKRTWYNNYNFSLIPTLNIRKADKYNTKSFQFNWLFIKLWSLDSFSFELSFTISSHWGIGFIGLLPYLRFVFCIPLSESLGMWIDKNLDRKPITCDVQN